MTLCTPCRCSSPQWWRGGVIKRCKNLGSVDFSRKLYLFDVGLIAQQSIKQRLITQLVAQHITAAQLLVTPTPFNSLLWRAVAVKEGEYYEVLASVLDKDQRINLLKYERNAEHLEQLKEMSIFNAYVVFSHDFYTSNNAEGEIIIKDLRMGFSPYLRSLHEAQTKPRYITQRVLSLSDPKNALFCPIDAKASPFLPSFQPLGAKPAC